jgi:hypothetical protein
VLQKQGTRKKDDEYTLFSSLESAQIARLIGKERENFVLTSLYLLHVFLVIALYLLHVFLSAEMQQKHT